MRAGSRCERPSGSSIKSKFRLPNQHDKRRRVQKTRKKRSKKSIQKNDRISKDLKDLFVASSVLAPNSDALCS